jgi:hypothetical protein
VAHCSNHHPEDLAALPAEPHTPPPATREEWAVLARAGEDPFAPAEPPLELEDVIGIDPEPSGQIFVDEVDEVAADRVALGSIVMPCDKHKGKPLAAIPRPYPEWTLTRSWCQATPLGLTIRDYLATLPPAADVATVVEGRP